MWIAGLRNLAKPLAHLHTQFNEELPWSTIDMDFMNLNQSAHGDREFGYIGSRVRLQRKVIVGYWKDKNIQSELGTWTRAACAWHDAQHLKISRFGDNMRNVAVTEGDKVEAQIRLRYTVNGFGVGDLAQRVSDVSDAEADKLTREYDDAYAVAETLRPAGRQRQSLREAARIELGVRRFLTENNSYAFTDTFEDLRGLEQLPGIAVQRLMADGYGFGAEKRLEGSSAGTRDEGDESRTPGWHVVHGRLHVPSERWRPSVGSAHAGGMSIHSKRQALGGDPPTFYRRKS